MADFGSGVPLRSITYGQLDAAAGKPGDPERGGYTGAAVFRRHQGHQLLPGFHSLPRYGTQCHGGQL
ncbi:hypothetical protein D3C85_1453820 [compost metagenome]